jgi:subtilisin family serine protease
LRRLTLAIAALGLLAARAEAQQPTVSPALQQLLQRDTVVTTWFFGARDRSLDEVRAAVSGLGGRVRRSSRWLHAVSAVVSTADLRRASTSSEFRHLQPVARFRGRPEEARAVPYLAPPAVAAANLDSLYGPSAAPLRQLDLFPLVDQGIRGSGVTIGVLDTGFETGNPAFDSATVIAQWDFVFDDSTVANEPADVPSASQHGTETWSLLAANLPTQIIGVAPEADYILLKTEDVRSETRVEEDNWVAALEWADSIGVDVVSSSVGYLDFDDGFSYAPEDLNGDVAVTTVAADSAAARGILVVAAMGNNGPGFRTMITPADGDSVLSAGAVDTLGVIAPFSSRGPTADGRLKPDLVAAGVDVFVVDPLSGSGFSRVNGTSFSTPLLAGAAALVRQLHPTLAPIDLIDALRHSGSNRAAPDSTRGWGVPDGAAAAYFPRGIVVTNPEDTLLRTVTPTFVWNVQEVAPVARPLSYRLRVATDTTFSFVALDTVIPDTVFTWTEILHPDDRFVFTVTVMSVDSVTLTTTPSDEFIVPEWATLLTLNDPAGTTTRELRPLFDWSSPLAVAPPGPYEYDIAIHREDNGQLELEQSGLTESEYRPPRDLEFNTPYRWQVVSHLEGDSAVTRSEGTFIVIDDSVPSVTLLFQNFPNPFPNLTTGSRTTCIWFDLATEGATTLDILDMRGRIVRNLVPGESFPTILMPGRYGRPANGVPGSCDRDLEWDGTASDGSSVPQGVYVVRLNAPDGSFFKRIVYMGPDF